VRACSTKASLLTLLTFFPLFFPLIREFFKDLRSLNVSPPTFFTRVSDYIPEIISFIQTVMAKGHAYSRWIPGSRI
jgi:cysteinyl-tRNA synthetase